MKIANILTLATLAAAAAPLATAQTPAPRPAPGFKPIPSPAPLPCPDQQVDRAAILNNIVRELEAAGLPPHEILGLMKVITPKVVNAPTHRHAQKPKRGPKAIPAVRIQPAPAPETIPATRIHPAPVPKALPKEANKEVRMKLFINGKEVDPDMISGSVITSGDLKIREVDPRTLNLPTPPAPKPGCRGPKPGPKPEGCPLPPGPKPGCDKAPAPRPTIRINGQEMPLPAEGGKVIINTDGGVTVLPAPKPGCAVPTPAPKPEACPLPPTPKPGCAAPKPAPKPEGCPLPPAPKPEGCPLPPAPANGGTIAKPVIGGADAPIATPKPAPEQEPAAGPVIKINGQPVELPEGGGKVIINADGRIISQG